MVRESEVTTRTYHEGSGNFSGKKGDVLFGIGRTGAVNYRVTASKKGVSNILVISRLYHRPQTWVLWQLSLGKRNDKNASFEMSLQIGAPPWRSMRPEAGCGRSMRPVYPNPQHAAGACGRFIRPSTLKPWFCVGFVWGNRDDKNASFEMSQMTQRTEERKQCLLYMVRFWG